MSDPSPSSRDAAAEDKAVFRRLMVFFALVYIVEGAGQIVGLLAQPLSYYLKEV